MPKDIMTKALFVTPFDPKIRKTGAQIRTAQIFEILQEKIKCVDVVWWKRVPGQLNAKLEIRRWSAGGDEYYFETTQDEKALQKPRLRALIDRNLFPLSRLTHKALDQYAADSALQPSEYDLVFFRYFASYQLFKKANLPRALLDWDDDPAEKYLSGILEDGHTGMPLVMRKMKFFLIKGEVKRTSYRFCAVSFSSRIKLGYTRNTVIVPNSITAPVKIRETPLRREKESTRRDAGVDNKTRIFFVAALGYFPNESGLKWFLSEVLPIVAKYKDVELRVAGSGASAELIDIMKDNKSVRYLGFCEDLYSEYELCDFSISPVRSGSGTSIKVIESIAMGKVCIATNFSARGLPRKLIENGCVVISGSAEEMANNIIRVIKSGVGEGIGDQLAECQKCLPNKRDMENAIVSMINKCRKISV